MNPPTTTTTLKPLSAVLETLARQIQLESGAVKRQSGRRGRSAAASTISPSVSPSQRRGRMDADAIQEALDTVAKKARVHAVEGLHAGLDTSLEAGIHGLAVGTI